MDSKTYTIEVEVEVIMTSKGVKPSYGEGGDPGEGPEFEIGIVTVSGKNVLPSEAKAEFHGDRYYMQRAIAARIAASATEQACQDDSWDDGL
jgi:hypothetical protein